MVEPLPEHMHFEASNRQYIVLGAVSALLVILLTAMRLLDQEPAYDANVWLTVFFAIVTLIAASAALFKRSWLKLDRYGFQSSELKALGKIAWSDVSEFRPYRQRVRGVPETRQVAFELTSEKQRVLGRLSGLLYKGTVRLTEHYQMKGPELAELMNRFRARAIVDKGARA
ncbi:hypothetical protein [Henriciella sp.]|uniref:hypothetical protein n=1 Tax=Henriciella sp. TaxID=1968823 RepID=UPI002601CA06|nr:hypothetical protein [Henriciella sp.]